MKARKRKPMPQIVSRIRWDAGRSRAKLESMIDEEVVRLWFERLSEHQSLRRSKVEPEQLAKVLKEHRSELDEVILRQAETFGCRLLLSSMILQRLGEWGSETNGPNLFVSLGKALAKSVRIIQKRGHSPIDNPDLVSTHDQAIRELRIVRREMRKTKTHRTPSYSELSKSFNSIVWTSRRRLPSLSGNRKRWNVFFQHNPELLSAFASQRRGSPAELFYQWLSWCTGHGTQTLRKTISALRNSLPRT